MDLKQAIEQYSEWKKLKFAGESHKVILLNFCMFMRNCEIDKVGLKDVEEWLKLHALLGYDQNTFVRRATCVRAFFEFLSQRGISSLNYVLIPIPPPKHKIPRICDEVSYSQLLDIVKNDNIWDIRNKAIIKLYWETGARNSELMSLNLSDLNLEECRATIRTEKVVSHFPFREIFWSKETNEDLKKWLEVREKFCKKKNIQNEAVFICVKGMGIGLRLTKKGVGEMLRRYSNLANIPQVNAHSFRHAFGRKLARQGANQAIIMSFLGHSNDGSSSVYTRLYGNDLKQLHEKYTIDKVKI